MSYLIDPSGRWWRWPSPVLAEKLGFPDADFDLAGYAVRNLGYVWLMVDNNVTFLQFRAGSVGGATLGSLKPYLQNAAPDKPVGLVYFASGWMEEVYTEPPPLLRRLTALAALREPRMRDLFMRQTSRPDDPAAGLLGQLYALWRDSGGRLGPGARDFLRRSGLEQRTVLSEAHGDGSIRVVASGAGFSIYDSFQMQQLVGRPIAEQPDQAYGQWVAQAYADCRDAATPLADDIDAIVEAPDHDPRRRRYQRLILPWRDAENRLLLSGSSVMKPDLRIPL